jgi:superfamily II DNA or RNA helicase
VAKKVKAKYVLGLTATFIRKDGHHPIIMMQCGPVMYKNSVSRNKGSSAKEHVVFIRKTNFAPLSM